MGLDAYRKQNKYGDGKTIEILKNKANAKYDLENYAEALNIADEVNFFVVYLLLVHWHQCQKAYSIMFCLSCVLDHPPSQSSHSIKHRNFKFPSNMHKYDVIPFGCLQLCVDVDLHLYFVWNYSYGLK